MRAVIQAHCSNQHCHITKHKNNNLSLFSPTNCTLLQMLLFRPTVLQLQFITANCKKKLNDWAYYINTTFSEWFKQNRNE